MVLPVGSVVKISGQLFLITGYRPVRLKNQVALGYVVMSYPFGFLRADKVLLCPAESVEELVASGYTGEKTEESSENIPEALLPIGSVVTLTEAMEKKYMIVGYYPSNETTERTYSVVPYPNGIVETKEIDMLGKEQIGNVVWKGYLDKKSEELIQQIPEFMKETSEVMKEFHETVQYVLQKQEVEEHVEDKNEISITMD